MPCSPGKFTLIRGVPFESWVGAGGAHLFLVNTKDQWDVFRDLAMAEKLVACDTETTGFNWFSGHRIVGMSFGWSDTHFYVPVRHEASLQEGPQLPQLRMEDLHADLVKFFADPERTTVWWNYKFDAHFYARENIFVKNKVHDGRILWQLFDENAPGALKTVSVGWNDLMGQWHDGLVGPDAAGKEAEVLAWRTQESRKRRAAFRNLVMAEADIQCKNLAYQHMTRNALKAHLATTTLADHLYAKSGKEEIHYGYVPIRLMAEYAALDTYLTYRAYTFCVNNIKWNKQLVALYKNEAQLLHALFDAEEHGVRISRKTLEHAQVDLAKQIVEITAEIKKTLGDVNLSSVPQMTSALTDLGVVLTKYTDATAEMPNEEDRTFALDKKVLSKLRGKYEVIESILKLREMAKLKGTYVDGILEKLSPDNVLHCSFNQNVSTGRMSASSPNLMNIPVRDKTIRKSFIPWDEDYTYLFADYSQIEVRLTAHLSQDPLLLDAYAKGQDVHTRTFCEMFGHEYDTVIGILADEQHPQYQEFSLLRTVAKRINFGIIYGVGAPALSEQIARPVHLKDASDKEWVDACQAFIDQYMAKYVGVKRFINRVGRVVRSEGQVTNELGRVRHLPHINATRIMKDKGKYWMEARAQRQGVNAQVQSLAADIFKIAAVRIYSILQGTKSKLVNFVHDEVQIYLHKDDFHLIPSIKSAMEDWNFTIPIIADFSTSSVSWGDKKSYKFQTETV